MVDSLTSCFPFLALLEFDHLTGEDPWNSLHLCKLLWNICFSLDICYSRMKSEKRGILKITLHNSLQCCSPGSISYEVVTFLCRNIPSKLSQVEKVELTGGGLKMEVADYQADADTKFLLRHKKVRLGDHGMRHNHRKNSTISTKNSAPRNVPFHQEWSVF